MLKGGINDSACYSESRSLRDRYNLRMTIFDQNELSEFNIKKVFFFSDFQKINSFNLSRKQNRRYIMSSNGWYNPPNFFEIF